MVKPGAAVYMEYADKVGQGEIVSRADMAERMGVGYSTAKYHLDRAVNAGLLNRAVVWIGRQTGWGYAQPETMPRLIDGDVANG